MPSILKVDQIQTGAGVPVFSSDGSVVSFSQPVAFASTGGSYGGTILQTVIYKSNTLSSLNVTDFTEASTDYRVTITPIKATSRILLTYFIATNNSMASNTLFMFRARNITNNRNVNGEASTSGSRWQAQWVGRPGNGYDTNDQMTCMWTCFDSPATTAAQTYGWQYRREGGGSGTCYFGYSSGDNSTFGFVTPITIIAQEVTV